MKLFSSAKYMVDNNTKLLLPQIFILAGLVVLMTITLRVGLGKVKEQEKVLSKLKKEQSLYRDKVTVLEAESSAVNAGADMLSWALPGKNPVLTVSSQIKSMSQQTLTPITDLKIAQGSGDKAGLATITIGFTIDASLEQLFGLLGIMEKMTPVMMISEVDITQRGEMVSADISAKAYWAKNPSKIPAISDPITRITPAEMDMLSMISDYSKPAFGTELPPSVSTRTSPF